jgi:hypothetical protein
MLSEAEKEGSPVYFLEYFSSGKRKIFSTENDIKLVAPPHNELNKRGSREWLSIYNVELSDDWHTAHQSVLDAITREKPARYPKYPSHTDDIFEHGAYWEGAVYYLKTVLNYNSEAEYTHDIINSTTMCAEFEIIYNSDGQLHLLDAYMSHVALKIYKSKCR